VGNVAVGVWFRVCVRRQFKVCVSCRWDVGGMEVGWRRDVDGNKGG
jgi:hypothetical protein